MMKIQCLSPLDRFAVGPKRGRIGASVVCFAALLMLPALLLPGASAQDGRAAESRSPITLLVRFPAGGGVDFAGRVLAEKLSAILARPVIVDNRPGAGGQIAARLLKAAPTDGSVLLISNAKPSRIRLSSSTMQIRIVCGLRTS